MKPTNWILMAALAASLPLRSAAVPAPAQAGVNVPWVKVNTVGYAADWPKTAVLNAEPKAVRLLDAKGVAVWSAKPEAVSAFGLDAASGDRCWQVDFSEFKTPGRYVVALEPLSPTAGEARWLRSFEFEIAEAPYVRALEAAQKMFYYQRTRTRLTEPYTLWDADDDAYTREGVSHDHEDVGWLLDDYPNKVTKLEMKKGWHDAGNFDMYIPSTAPTVQALLFAFQTHPQVFGDADNIPESGNGIPDVLDEATWGLDWMLPLQEQDGSFRAREAVMKLGEVGDGPADHDKSTRWVSGVGSASTAKACAALAQAARVFKPYDKRRSEDYARAALKAWAWLQAHPEKVKFDPKGSDQPLWDDSDEYSDENGSRAAAAAQIWVAFRQPAALKYLQSLWKEKQLGVEGLNGAWVNIGRFALYAIVLDLESPQAMRAEAKARILEGVQSWRTMVERENGYRVALGFKDYYWGTPSNLMERLQLLAMAHRLDPQLTWARDAARDQWHWVLGRNPNAYSLVSRVGQGPTRIYHLEWGKKRVPPPGFMVDGPNGANADFLAPGMPAKALLWDNPKPLTRSGLPAHAMWHNAQSDLWDGAFVPEGQWTTGWWVVTEVDIYYNANLVWAAAFMQEP